MKKEDLVIKLIDKLIGNESGDVKNNNEHPMLGKLCVIRTYSAGVHIGKIEYINPESSMEIKLVESFRLCKWEDGGLSLSAIARNGIKGGRVNRTGEVYLTNVIEMIPTSDLVIKSLCKFLEDE